MQIYVRFNDREEENEVLETENKKIGKNMFEYKTGSEEDMPWMHQNSYCLF